MYSYVVREVSNPQPNHCERLTLNFHVEIVNIFTQSADMIEEMINYNITRV